MGVNDYSIMRPISNEKRQMIIEAKKRDEPKKTTLTQIKDISQKLHNKNLQTIPKNRKPQTQTLPQKQKQTHPQTRPTNQRTNQTNPQHNHKRTHRQTKPKHNSKRTLQTSQTNGFDF
ncbi:MAG: hypothetical protein LBQ98_03575 [Nitrososphaerota archaeon]|jgi:hypothetical protein|nr:hypothetical protein [Nitrososphaerota archaeon]